MGAFDPLITYEKGTYIETDTGNKVSRRAVIAGATNIILGGKSIIQSGAILRGDLRRATAGQHVVISMGRYCLIGENAVLRPPGKIYKGVFTFYPVKIADYVHIGPSCVIEAAQIGHGVEIGKGCILGKFVIIKDLVVLLPDTVLPEGTVVPSLTVWGGNPGRCIESLPETYQETVEARCKGYYQRFRPSPSPSSVPA
ncbi:trimeric LpxA-like protein [Naematelia encephala]|uniref:Dynactin subunit 5 n=1 Tax=Naematelia encephala TaxID=71784 RepID=A0A1Y2ADJ7_9TREE|nr:trimeric LpxA-like protein [Naematelia encephala]